MGRGALIGAVAALALAGVALVVVMKPSGSREPQTAKRTAPAATPPRADAPSILLLTLDTTRADALRCEGAPYSDASPNLDALAAEGTRFAQARTTVPMSLPSHSSMMTGRWPFETGVRDNSTFRLGPGAHTLAKRFKAAGYTTGAVIGSFVLHSVFGLNQGFDVYSDPPLAGIAADAHSEERTANQVTDECLRFLDEKTLTPPFFLWAHYFDPHFPFEPPEPFLSRFLKRAAAGGKGRARYAGEVAFMDQEIGRLLKEVRVRLGTRPLVVLAIGDHGEALGDHGEDSHGMLLYDATLRVPCILAGGGVPRGAVVATPVSTIDVAPTLLELGGLERDDVSGISWLATARAAATGAEAPDEGSSRPLYYEALSPYFGYGWSPLFAVEVGSLIFIDGPRPELFDVAADPGQTRNLLDARPDDVRRARLHFERWRAAAAAAAATVDRPDLTQEQREKIAKIGYVSAFADTNLDIPVPGQIDAKRRDPRDGGAIVHKMFEVNGLLAQGKVKPANALVDELLTIDGDNPLVAQVAAQARMAAGDPARALPLLEKAVARRGEITLRLSLAQALNQLGRRVDALKVLDLLVAEHAEFLRARLLRGDLLIAAGRKAEAAADLDYFIAHYPGNDEPKKMAQQLLERARAK